MVEQTGEPADCGLWRKKLLDPTVRELVSARISVESVRQASQKQNMKHIVEVKG